MASARDIKRRIKSVKSTQQITKAMKMVSASKLRKSQTAVTAVRPFMRKIDEMILHVGEAVAHPYLQEKQEVRRVCYLLIGSDRGLCGGFNGNLHRFLDHVLQETAAAESAPEFAAVVLGRKAMEHCARRGYPVDVEYAAIGDNPDFSQARQLSHLLREAFDEQKYDEIYMVYSEFKSALVQRPTIKRLLPIVHPQTDGDAENRFAAVDYIFEPDQQTVVEALLPQYIDIGVYCALQEAKASEHGARMTAMNSATDNATEMINKLTLSLNRARQAAITTEISEIVGGAAALS